MICLGDQRGQPLERLGQAVTKDAPHRWVAGDFRKDGQTLAQAEAALDANEAGLNERWRTGQWNALLLQPSGKLPVSETIAVCRRLIDRFFKDYPTGQIYLYGAWPEMNRSLLAPVTVPHPLQLPQDMALYRQAFAFERQWLAQTPAGINRAAQEAVFTALQKQYPKLWEAKRLRLIPVGDVFYEMSKHIAGGWLPGVDNITRCYADERTLRPGLPQYLADVALYAAVFGGQGAYVHEPVALDVEFYNRLAGKDGLPLSREQAKIIEQWVWRYTTAHRLINNPRNQLPDNVPTRAWPSIAIRPMLDVPLRDTAICRGPDGAYYLTGTLGPDFDNSRVIKLWKSTNLVNWTELGVAWDLDTDPMKNIRASTGQRYWRRPLGAGQAAMARGIVAPELHYIKGNWYICFSINNQGCHLLKSQTGQPAGPYVDVGQITIGGGDPSLFEDDDGKVYFLFDGGWMARMKDDLTGLAERPRLLQPQPASTLPRGYNAAFDPNEQSDHPRQVGQRGAFLFKAHGRYYLTAADDCTRTGFSVNDTFIAYADNIYGPYSHRHYMVGHGGGVTVFQDTEGDWWTTFYGADDRAAFRDRPSIVPLKWITWDDWDLYFPINSETFPRQPQHVFTERGPWAEMRPFLNVAGRDLHLFNAPNGYYYFSGSMIGRPDELVIWRSRDLIHWEEIPIMKYQDLKFIDALKPVREFYRVFWHCPMYRLKDNYWIRFDIFLPERPWGPYPAAWLRSTSGQPEGPYEVFMHNDTGLVSPVQGADGKFYVFRGVPGDLWSAEFTEIGDPLEQDLSQYKFQRVITSPPNMKCVTDGPGGVLRVGGKFIYVGPRWGGAFWSQELERSRYLGTYDIHYLVGLKPTGPFGRPRVIPHGNIGTIFQDKKGYYWAVQFGNEHTGPWWSRPGLVPLKVTETEDDLLIELAEDLDEYQREIIRAGR